jgi:hypothetical protein
MTCFATVVSCGIHNDYLIFAFVCSAPACSSFVCASLILSVSKGLFLVKRIGYLDVYGSVLLSKQPPHRTKPWLFCGNLRCYGDPEIINKRWPLCPNRRIGLLETEPTWLLASVYCLRLPRQVDDTVTKGRVCELDSLYFVVRNIHDSDI